MKKINLTRRTIIQSSALLPSLWYGQSVFAQNVWPNKPVHILVPNPAGGTADLLPRLISQELAKRLGQSVIIDNKPGAAGNIAAETLYNAEPDGYLIMLSSVGPLAYSPHIFKLGYDPLKDLTPIGLGVTSGNALIINPQQLKAKTLAEFVAIAEKTPGGVAYGSCN